LGEAEFPVSPERIIVVRAQRKGGRKLLDVRTYIDSDSFVGFTGKGINIPLENSRNLVNAIHAAVTEAGACGDSTTTPG